MIRDWRLELQRALSLDPSSAHYPEYEDAAAFASQWRAKMTAGKPSSVLILLSPSEDPREHSPRLLLTRRADHLLQHQGQIAFPGGRRDPEDASAIDTALREAQEEVGLNPGNVEVLGVLPPLPTTTGFRVEPVVAWSSACIHSELTANPEEIAEMFWVPWRQFQAEGVYRREIFESKSDDVQVKYPTHVYQIGTYRVWGATAAMIRYLTMILK